MYIYIYLFNINVFYSWFCPLWQDNGNLLLQNYCTLRKYGDFKDKQYNIYKITELLQFIKYDTVCPMHS